MQTRIAAVISVAERTGPGAGDGPEPAYNCLLGREAALRARPSDTHTPRWPRAAASPGARRHPLAYRRHSGPDPHSRLRAATREHRLAGPARPVRSCPRPVRGVRPSRALLRRDSASVGRLVAGDDELAAFPRAGDRARLLAGRPLRRTGATDRNGTNRELPRPRDPDRARVRDRHGS